MATKSKGFKVPCPHCGTLPESGLTLSLGTLDMECPDCGEGISAAELKRYAETVLAETTRLLRWLDMSRTVNGDGAAPESSVTAYFDRAGWGNVGTDHD